MSGKIEEIFNRGPDKKEVDALTSKQRMFVHHLLEDPLFRPVTAARVAGYKNPESASQKLMKKHTIRKMLGKTQRDREKRCELKADDVLNYLKNALYINPLHYFRPCEDGSWRLLSPENMPEEIGRLIEEMKVRTVTKKDGTTESFFEVKLVSKTTALMLAMKHTSVEHSEVKVSINWDQLMTPPKPEETDAHRIQQMIIDVTNAPSPNPEQKLLPNLQFNSDNTMDGENLSGESNEST